MEKVGYIYILTNESFHRSNWVKIGYTENIERRVKELSNTSVPMPFEVYATYEIPASAGIADKALHKIIQKLNPELRLSNNREFFEIEPWDAYDLLDCIATINGRKDKLVRNKNNKFFNDPEKANIEEEYTEESLFPSESYVGALYRKIKEIALSMYPELVCVPNKNYVPFKKGKKHNVISLWPKENSIEVVLNAKLGTIDDSIEIVYDISNRLWSAAQYAFRYDDQTDIKIVKKLIQQTYDLVK